MKKFSSYFSFSLITHLSVLLVSSIIFSSTVGFEKTPQHILSGYIYHESQKISQAEKSESSYKKPKDFKSTPLKSLPNSLEQHSIIQSKASQQMTDAASNEENHQELLKILHNAIAENQQYPENAQALNQSGTTQVSMTIFPDGHIENVTVLTSSGYDSLDSAALAAVQASAPIKQANLYLKNKDFFSVNISFKI